MLYEMRIYDVTPGKMEAILNRFRDHTISLFAKHGMKVVEFWVDAEEGNNRLYYVLEHPDKPSRERNFGAFSQDQEWLALKEVTEQDGPLYQKIDVIYMNEASFFRR